MIPEAISIGGAAFRSSYIQEFTRAEWVKMQMGKPAGAWPDKTPEVREQLFGKIWDLANPETIIKKKR